MCRRDRFTVSLSLLLPSLIDSEDLLARIFFNLSCMRRYLSSNAKYKTSPCTALKSHNLPPVATARHRSSANHDFPIFGLPARINNPWGKIFSAVNCSGSNSMFISVLPSMVFSFGRLGLGDCCGGWVGCGDGVCCDGWLVGGVGVVGCGVGSAGDITFFCSWLIKSSFLFVCAYLGGRLRMLTQQASWCDWLLFPQSVRFSSYTISCLTLGAFSRPPSLRSPVLRLGLCKVCTHGT